MTVWMWLSLLSVLALPQLLGVLLYFRLRRYSRWLAFSLGTLAPAVIFFFLVRAFILAGMPEPQAGEVSCGMPGVVLGLALLAGIGIQLLVALPVQVYLFGKSK